ncbi:MAG: hydroxyacid dehydrogenase [Stygiobacter sp. RIFOXYC12_FULL_38_8]|nr:MAG: hydroxyacid dehydrogenase [Stygiobacter sp. GWC2_38_9]OGV07336.1 MAG: hydroxyacid dehydrogenase [Stygiobacter sp. RIFOXYB2_FULL_37_11]OGV09936.1 MAG: hydroxyacid dehydrogenase [Stygiobacter sp. RIFOXYA2_FULL_38_8]OGV15871.1 MAG: hydroxyacid dehydrogenase [Stygiobacter sp. RIFOXYC2_FULL_38_25]OGV22805.1 MAG: hydroxyacid dehydrogenase [Stygiobacter sp. RIFOXYC12_FULL_38_8]OGV81001.1 MAG: hydroxyacid dehydrogenase [Stygiobacter sp. GWF2_38_21]RJQ57513.1 MAG: hydroxyacid dehydrogenase [St
MLESNSEIIFYRAEDGTTKIDVRLEKETVWLNQVQMAALFQTTKQNISLHINNLFEEGELNREASVKDYLTVQIEGKRDVSRSIEHYNLDVIISVGYRVKSNRGTQFRIWATQRIKEYLVKGFVLDDERLKQARNDYFDELLERVRDIRTSEKIFYRKVTDIYATSVDYNPEAKATQEFFATVQNKFHYAIHGHTASELIAERADSKKPYMGLTSWKGSKIKKTDVTIAKNYLSEEEIKQLNLIVDQYLSFAELQAMQRKSMTMQDWINKLHDFLTINERTVLMDAGRIQKKIGEEIALKELVKYQEIQKQKELENPSSDFDKAVKKLTERKK